MVVHGKVVNVINLSTYSGQSLLVNEPASVAQWSSDLGATVQ